jgi:hypothetical protein
MNIATNEADDTVLLASATFYDKLVNRRMLNNFFPSIKIGLILKNFYIYK